MENYKKKQRKILVVDDMLATRNIVGDILRKAHYNSDFAGNGHQALELLKNYNDYDLVLLDIEMPEMNGFEVCRAIRQNDKLREIPVIFLTSSDNVENKVAGFNSGAQDYVIKPFNPKELLARVKTHIQLKQKSDIIKDMNNILVKKNKEITDSISYALHIQKAIAPPLENLSKMVKDGFVMDKPKDIVSGDFLWHKNIGNSLYIVLADCTGHGIPGAFMSVLGISMLNEIIKDNSTLPPNQILNRLREKIIRALNQNADFKNKDGMDICVCQINFENSTIQYSGALINLYIVRKDFLHNQHKLIKISSDHMPVGIYPNASKSFSNQVVDFVEGDRLYLFSDGYVSQFGGEENKTFKIKRLRSELLTIQHLSMADQLTKLEDTLSDWKGNNEQVDDILMLGIQV
jgi:phosphoserine phosphatase RsbU/P